MVLLDAGASMRLPLRERANDRPSDWSQRDRKDVQELHTRFAAAVAAVENVVQQKVTSTSGSCRSKSGRMQTCNVVGGVRDSSLMELILMFFVLFLCGAEALL